MLGGRCSAAGRNSAAGGATWQNGLDRSPMLLELGTGLIQLREFLDRRQFIGFGAALMRIGGRRNASVEPGFMVQFRVANHLNLWRRQ
jgi:hypothetical protein